MRYVLKEYNKVWLEKQYSVTLLQERIDKTSNTHMDADILFDTLSSVVNTHYCIEDEGLNISSCIRIFGEYSSSGIWDCSILDETPYQLSKQLTNLLAIWSSWYKYLEDCKDACNFSILGVYGGDTISTFREFEEQCLLFTRVGVQLAKWVKIEHPICKVFYLNDYEFDGFTRHSTFEIVLENNNLIIIPVKKT